MTIIDAIIMGIIQGLTEFLPVSSSGHLVLYTMFTGATPSLLFDLIVHLGTVLALIIVFFKDVKDLVLHPLSKKVRLILFATIFTALFAFALKDIAVDAFSGKALPYCFLVTAVVLFLGTVIPKKSKKPRTEIGYLDAAIIGSIQGIAVFPGLSRSGTTISTANLLGCKKEENAKFCLLISIPVIIGSSLLEVLTGTAAFVPFYILIIGFFTSFICGLIALKFLISLIKKSSFIPFSVYLVLLSAFLILGNIFSFLPI